VTAAPRYSTGRGAQLSAFCDKQRKQETPLDRRC
jgi:hypothetical protein